MSTEAIKHYESALHEAFPSGATGNVFKHWNRARQAIAEAEIREHGEPVAGYFYTNDNGCYIECDPKHQGEEGVVPLYTTPQQRTWVGLTDEEINDLVHSHDDFDGLWEFTDAVEAKLKEKNTK